MEFKRKQFDIVLERIKEPRGKIQVVIGPRQVGKSTLMDQVLEQWPIGIVYHCCNAYQKETSALCACFF